MDSLWAHNHFSNLWVSVKHSVLKQGANCDWLNGCLFLFQTSIISMAVFPKGLGLFFLFSPVTRYNKHISLGDFISVRLWTQNPSGKRQSFTWLRGFLTYVYMFYIYLYLYIYILHWVFIAACGYSLVAVSGGFSCCGAGHICFTSCSLQAQ